MPFTTTPDLPNGPSVRIFFIGLNILMPITVAQTGLPACQAFVHNSSPEHKLVIEVRKKRLGQPDVLMARILGPLPSVSVDPTDPTLTHGLLIRTAGLPPNAKGVKAYQGTKVDEGYSLFDGFILSDILDVSPGHVDPVGGLPSIFIDHGIFYLADKVVVKANLVKFGGTTIIKRTDVPTIVGANIYLDPNVQGQKVNLKWRQNGTDVTLDLIPAQHITHEIYVINEPLFEPDSPQAPQHDEFAEYFNILPEVMPQERYSLVFLEPIPDRGSTRTPCMSVLLTR
jgi:hypothetical protein